MTTASVRFVRRNNDVAPLPEVAARVGVLAGCLAVSAGSWWAFSQVILRIIS
jgi:hypothetical protein